MVALTWRLSLLTGLTFLFCGYCILLGGLAGLTDACYDIPAHDNRPTRRNPGHVVTKFQWLRVHQESNINPNSDCGFIYGYYWWIFCLNFVAWCAAALELFRPRFFRVGAAALMAATAVADQEYSHDFLTLSRKLSANHFHYGAVPSARTVVAGFIISAVSAYWLILTLGCDKAVEGHDDDRDGDHVGAASTVPPEGGKRGGKQQGARGSRPIGTDTAGAVETVEVDVGVAAATV